MWTGPTIIVGDTSREDYERTKQDLVKSFADELKQQREDAVVRPDLHGSSPTPNPAQTSASPMDHSGWASAMQRLMAEALAHGYKLQDENDQHKARMLRDGFSKDRIAEGLLQDAAGQIANSAMNDGFVSKILELAIEDSREICQGEEYAGNDASSTAIPGGVVGDGSWAAQQYRRNRAAGMTGNGGPDRTVSQNPDANFRPPVVYPLLPDDNMETVETAIKMHRDRGHQHIDELSHVKRGENLARKCWKLLAGRAVYVRDGIRNVPVGALKFAGKSNAQIVSDAEAIRDRVNRECNAELRKIYSDG